MVVERKQTAVSRVKARKECVQMAVIVKHDGVVIYANISRPSSPAKGIAKTGVRGGGVTLA